MKKQTINRNNYSREQVVALNDTKLCLIASNILSEPSNGNSIYFLTNLAHNENSLYRKTLESKEVSTYSTEYAMQVINLHDLQKMLELFSTINKNTAVNPESLSMLRGYAVQFLQLYRSGKDTPETDQALTTLTDVMYESVKVETKNIPVLGYTKQKVLEVATLTPEQLSKLKQTAQVLEGSFNLN